MPWRPLPNIAFAVCTYPFHPTSTADLPLQIGDDLYVIEEGGRDGAWLRGYLVAPPSLLAGLSSDVGQPLEARVFAGIFPRACVEIREEFDDASHTTARKRRRTTQSWSATPDSPRISGEWPTPPRGLNRVSKTAEPIDTNNSKPDSGVDQYEFPRPPTSPQKDIKPSPSQPKPPAPVPMLKIGDETSASKREPLIDEIASCLREWHSTNLHQLLLDRQYDRLDQMSHIVTRLDTARRQLHHNILTDQELVAVREAAVWDLVHGNRLLSNEVIVRSLPKGGRMLTAEDSALDVSSLQATMSLLDDRPKPAADLASLHHVAIRLRDFANKSGNAMTLSINLCARDRDGSVKNLTEMFSIEVPVQGATVEEDRLDWRTLFTDLSANDIKGATGKETQLILLIKALSSEPVRQPTEERQRTPTNSNSTASTRTKNLTVSSRATSIRAARRSVMFGFKGRNKDSGTEVSDDSRPTTADTLQVKTPEFGAQSKAQVKYVKRITGIAALDITDFLQAEGDAERDLTLWSVLPQLNDRSSINGSDLDLDEIPEQTLAGALLGSDHRLKLEGTSAIAKMRIAFHSFVKASSVQLIESRPTLLQGIPTTRKVGFAEAPHQVRSDIYVTLKEPLLALNGFLSHPIEGTVPLPSPDELVDLQLTIEVRNAAGDRIESCIYPFSNGTGFTAWRTVAVDRGERWNQIIRLAVDAEDVPGSHLVMSVAASLGHPFALCWLPLWTQGAFIKDGEQVLSLHKYDEHTSEMMGGQRAYLNLPWNARVKDEAVTGSMATLKLDTYLCSTQYSQDPTLLGILKWREQRSKKDLVATLHRYLFVPELEIVKLLDDVLDALFDILVQHTGHDEIEDLTFNALVNTLSIVNDHRFNLQPRIDEYAKDRFRFPFAFPCLTRSFRHLLQDPTDNANASKLRQTCKVGRKIFRFIVTARKQQIAKEVDIGVQNHAPTIAKDLEPIFHDMREVMRSASPSLVGTKTLMVQNFHKWLLELTEALTSADILRIAVQFLDSCAKVSGRLILYRLLLIQRVTSAQLFTEAEDEKTWNEKVARWMSPYLQISSPISQQWRDQVRMSCSVIAAQRKASSYHCSEWTVDLTRVYLTLQDRAQIPHDHFSLLFPDNYPFPSRPMVKGLVLDESSIEVSAIIAELSGTRENYITQPTKDLDTFLKALLQVLTSILSCQAFPTSWITLLMYHHKSTLQALQVVFSILSERFLPNVEEADEFPTDLWSAYFNVLLHLVSSEALSLETFQEQKRRAVWKIAGDVREVGADLLLKSWEAIAWQSDKEQQERYGLERLGGYQVQYVPSMVGQVTQLCLSVHEGLRKTALTILTSMIINEWEISQDLHAIESEMVSCLEDMFRNRKLDEGMLQKTFVQDLMGQFEQYGEQDSGITAAVRKLVDVIDELLQLLVAVHSAESIGETFRIVDTIRLMEFLKDMQRESIYVGYVHRLASIQDKAGNPTEAGLALRMHADLYKWDHTRHLDGLADPLLPPQTAFDRKEHLYFETIRHFERGAAWHHALATYNELAQVYATNAFDFAKLARTQRAMASVYERIHKGEVSSSRFFRVLFRGMGFSTNLRNKEFIFEGSASDRVSGFGDRLLQQYPAARIISGDLEEEIEGQYVTIYPVGPQKDLVHPVNRRSKVSHAVRAYFMLSAPNQFTMSSRWQATAGGVEDQVQTKTIYTTADTFPNILRRSEIIKVETAQMSPPQIGLERTTRKTQDLLSLQSKALNGAEDSILTLTEVLRSLTREKSTGSMVQYWRLLPVVHDAEATQEPQNSESTGTLSPLQEALKVALVDHAWAIARCLALYAKPAHQAVRAELTKDFEASFAPILSSMTSAQDVDTEKPWLWNMTSRTAEPTTSPTAFDREVTDTRAGASEPLTPFAPSDPEKARAVQQSTIRTNGVKPVNQHEPILLSSRTSVDFESENPYGNNVANGAAKASANTAKPLSNENGLPSATSSNRQSRIGIGSVTRRWSQLGIGKKGSKDKVKSTIEPLVE